MAALTSQNIITMNINNLENLENTTTHSNVSLHANILNLHMVTLSDSNTILHENHINSPLENITTTTTTTTTINTTQPQTRRVLPPSIVIVSSDDEESDVVNNINTILQNKNDKNDKNDKDKKLKIGLKTSTRSKSSLKKIKNVNNKLDNNSIDDERESSTKNITAPLAKKKLTIYTYEQLNIEKYKMDELRKLCMQYKVSRAGNKEEITKRLYDYCKNSIVPLKIQKVVRGFLHRKLIKLRGPAFKKRNICTNETDFFTMDEMHEIPYEQFYSYKDIDGFIYGFNILSLHNLISKEGDGTKNPYNRNSIPIIVKQDIRQIVKLAALLKSPIDIVIKQEILDPRKRMEMKILDLFQTINSYGNYSNSEWFSTLNQIGHVRFARELYDIWNYRAQLANIKKYEICPPHGNPFMGTPYFTNTASNNTLVNLGIDVLIRFNVQIIENLVKSAIDIDNKTLGSFYVLTALTLVSEPARNAMPWLYEAGVYGGHDGV
jgi:hypothetical protein